MANEKRLIWADDALAAEFTIEEGGAIAYVVDSEVIRRLPTVDAVEVVRCKDCKHAGINENHPNRPLLCFMTMMCGTTKPEWFCADGERRE